MQVCNNSKQDGQAGMIDGKLADIAKYRDWEDKCLRALTNAELRKSLMYQADSANSIGV
jgi:hypothetical protein